MPRTRSKAAHTKVLEAAVRLFAERGIDATSMDAIAESSGVSKATIYKHWPGKGELVTELVTWLYGFDEDRPKIAPKNLRVDLIAVLSHRPGANRTKLKERLMPHLIAYSARNPEFGKAWRTRIISLQRDDLRLVIDAAMARGELDRSLDFDMAVALLLGPMMYRQIFIAKNRTEKPPRAYIEQVVDAVIRSSAKSEIHQ
jgi:AcrR family transcriptional regulator